jgi:hypothetical protein
MTLKKAHYVIYSEDLCRRLGVEGQPTKMYVEQEADYLHIIVEGEDLEDGHDVAPGGYVEATVLPMKVH